MRGLAPHPPRPPHRTTQMRTLAGTFHPFPTRTMTQALAILVVLGIGFLLTYGATLRNCTIYGGCC